jgi:chromosome segregation ATPase
MEHAVKEHETLKDQIGFYMKQIEALQTAKIELHSQIEMLNNELDKARTVDSKFINVQQEKRDLMQHNSELKNELEKFKLKYFETNARFEEMSQKLRFDSNCIHRLSSYFWF